MLEQLRWRTEHTGPHGELHAEKKEEEAGEGAAALLVVDRAAAAVLVSDQRCRA